MRSAPSDDRRPRLRTALTDLLGTDLPIVLAGMTRVSVPRLVAAVSNAGGLGILATAALAPEATRAAIRQVRDLTSRPFGVGVPLLIPGARENAGVALDERVPVINFSLGMLPSRSSAARVYCLCTGDGRSPGSRDGPNRPLRLSGR